MPQRANLVVRGVALDPPVRRVGSDCFLAGSTCDFWPGIAVRHTMDRSTGT